MKINLLKNTKSILLFIGILFSGWLNAQTDSLSTVGLEGIVVEAHTSLKLTPKNGKYEVKVKGTNFQNTQNTWEGLKQVPMLQAEDGSGLKVNNKTAIVEVNGSRIQMNGADLEGYLKSLDPDTIKKIEINPNPNASYGTEVSAVVNIVLSEKRESYRLGVNTTNGIRSKYYNNSNINYALNGKKVSFYINYTFDYLPQKNTSEIEQKTGNTDLLHLHYDENNLLKKHQAYSNLSVTLSPQNQLDFSALVSYFKENTDGHTFNHAFNRNIDLEEENKTLQTAAHWTHTFNDTVSLKIGGYQVLRDGKAFNQSLTNTIEESQKVETKIPIYIAYADYNNKNKYGLSSAGVRFNHIDVTNDNQVLNKIYPFRYKEKVFAAYLNHTIPLPKNKNIEFGLRSETTFIDYNYNEGLGNKDNYTNILYNASYNWVTEKGRYNNLAFRKQIQRPNYSYLNPFESISTGNTYFEGDSRINPAKIYTLNYETNKKNFTFFSQVGMVKDFISSFYESDNNRIITTYKNFETVYLAGGGVQYNKHFFNRKWITKTTLNATYVKLKDKNYHIASSSPIVQFSTVNVFNLGRKFMLNTQYRLSLPYKDGLLKHGLNHKLNLSLSKRVGGNFTLIAFLDDLLKTAYKESTTTIPGYYYSSKYYDDVRAFGLTLRWDITGKTYKRRALEGFEEDEINRL